MVSKTKKFDGVEMSRRLREATSRKLEAMNREEQLAFLREAGERHRAEVKAHIEATQATR
jgi:hypothetical protein